MKMDLKEFISERFTDIKDTMKANKEELKSDINKLRKIDLNDYLMYPEN